MMSEQEQPLTREDVLKLIERHGGSAKELNLSGVVFEPGIDLSSLDLTGIILKGSRFSDKPETRQSSQFQRTILALADLENAHLERANLQEAHLWGANLQNTHLSGATLQKAEFWGVHTPEGHYISDLRGADLRMANLSEAKLTWADLRGADLRWATLAEATMGRVELSPDTKLENVYWGDYILGGERRLNERQTGDFQREQESYRQLKQWHTQAGMYDIAGKFHYREMEMQRKATKWRTRPIEGEKTWQRWSVRLKRLSLEMYRLLCGYGEKSLNVIAAAVVVVFGMALGIYAASTLTFLSSLYFSAVSFTALGYGLGVSNTDSWVKGLGAVESFIGVFLIALFLVTFVRKMTR